MFDKDIRKLNLVDSDFHNKQLDKLIEIVVTLDISDTKDSDCQKLRAQLKGALQSMHSKVYIKLLAGYNKNELLALPLLYWGGDLDNLQEMKQRGYLYEIDYVFNVIYIDSYVDLYSLFKGGIGMAFVNEKLSEEQRQEFVSRGIKRPWSERIANPIYRTVDVERNMCLWELGNLGRDYFDHYMFLFEWNGEEHFIIMEYIDPGTSEDYIMWSLSKYEKNVISNKSYAEDFKEALIQYAVNGRPDQVVDFNIKVNLKGENEI